MENRFKMRISRMFGSFGSCRTRKLSDVIEKPVFVPENQKNFHVIDPLPPKPRPLPSVCRPKCPESTTKAINHCIIPRQKVSRRYPAFVSADADSHGYLPASPISPLNPFYRDFGFKEKKKCTSSVKNRKKKKTKSHVMSRRRDVSLFSSSSQDSAYFGDSYWSSSEEEKEDERQDESDTLFSSRSLSSDSSGSRRRRSRRKKHSRSSRRRAAFQMGVLPLEGKVRGILAVEKSSSDPYSDFRTSMVEMIVEKQIFSAKDLEQLLQCFLSLNSHHHHRTIIEVFTEIWEALFSNWS